MPIQYLTKTYTVNTGGTIQLDLTQPIFYYDFSGTSTLSSGYSITTTGTPNLGMSFVIRWRANMTLSGNTLTVMGKTIKASAGDLPAEYSTSEWEAHCYYNGSSWDVHILADEITTSASGASLTAGTVPLTALTNIDRGKVIVGNASGVPVKYDLPTVGSGAILITDGTDTDGHVLSGDVTMNASGAVTIANNAITTVKITDDNVTMAKIEDIGRGYVIIGDASGEPAKYNLPGIGSGAFLITDGTDTTGVTMSGDATMAASGAITVANNAISNAKMADMAANTIKVRNSGSSGDPSDIALASAEILIGNGAGFTAAALSGDVTMTNAGVVTLASEHRTLQWYIPASFETGEQCGNRFQVAFTGTIDSLNAYVTKAIAAIDDATLTLQNVTTGSGTTVITIPASSALDSNVVTAGIGLAVNTNDIIRITSAKVTAGGKVLISVKGTRT